ncbi:MAG: hypothetical protein WC553_02480 [Patescibacteria group bacterium]
MADGVATIDWLPAIVELGEHSGNWDKYIDAIYAHYCKDFVASKPLFRGLPVVSRFAPPLNGKGITFWHLVSEGKTEATRIPDLRRCERVCWVRPMIENSASLKVWEVKRKDKLHVCIALSDWSYVVVLAPRNKGYFVLLTAYTVEYDHRKRRLEAECEEWCKTNTAQ